MLEGEPSGQDDFSVEETVDGGQTSVALFGAKRGGVMGRMRRARGEVQAKKLFVY